VKLAGCARPGVAASGERRGLNGDGVCAMVWPFDNEGRRGGERRALDERVYTFVYTSGNSS